MMKPVTRPAGEIESSDINCEEKNITAQFDVTCQLSTQSVTNETTLKNCPCEGICANGSHRHE